MLLSKVKKSICLMVALSFFAASAFPSNLKLQNIVEVGAVYEGQAEITQAINFYNYQVDSQIVSAKMAAKNFKTNIDQLVEKGIDIKLIENQILEFLPQVNPVRLLYPYHNRLRVLIVRDKMNGIASAEYLLTH